MNYNREFERRAILSAGLAGAALLIPAEAQAQEKRPGGLSTHVLDTYSGIPAEGMTIEFFKADGDTYRLDKTIVTNAQGRTDQPVMPVTSAPGKFQLMFHVAEYFKKQGLDLPEPAFLDRVSLHFAIAKPDEHYHVPLLCSPWSYVTYRGS